MSMGSYKSSGWLALGSFRFKIYSLTDTNLCTTPVQLLYSSPFIHKELKFGCK